MFKLDRTFSTSGNFKDSKKESEYYRNMTFDERAKVFAYLQSVAYNFEIGNSPRLDKSIHSAR